MAQFTNQAQLSYNNITTNSNIAVGEILEVLSISKTALSDEYVQNDRVAFIVSLLNSGATAISSLTLTDDLGAYELGTSQLTPLSYVDGSVKYYINGVLQAAPAVTAGPPLVISGLSVPAQGNAIIAYEAQANSFAPLASGSSITNTVVASGGGITETEAQETIDIANTPLLSITKSISPVPVAENGTLTYTFTITNTGNTPAAATDNVIVTDIFDPLLSDISVSLNGAPLSPVTDYTYNETTGEFATVAGRITVPAATYTQDPISGIFSTTPGITTLTVSGTV